LPGNFIVGQYDFHRFHHSSCVLGVGCMRRAEHDMLRPPQWEYRVRRLSFPADAGIRLPLSNRVRCETCGKDHIRLGHPLNGESAASGGNSFYKENPWVAFFGILHLLIIPERKARSKPFGSSITSGIGSLVQTPPKKKPWGRLACPRLLELDRRYRGTPVDRLSTKPATTTKPANHSL